MRSTAAPVAVLAAVSFALLSPRPGGAAPILWNTDSSGDWSAASSWNPAQVPGVADDVTIDRGGASPTVTHGSGNDTVASIANEESLLVDGGTLDTGAYAAGTSSRVTVDGTGVRFRSTGATTLDGATLFATEGGLLDLSLATSYASNGSRTVEASGQNGDASTVDLSGVSDLTGATNFNAELRVNALSGGFVDLGGVSNLVDSSVLFKASGAGSVIDVSSLEAFVDGGSSLDVSLLEASGGGAILLNTTQPLTFDGYTIRRSGVSSTLDTSQLTTLANSTVEATGLGVTLDLTSVASFDGNSLIARNGASLALHGASYTAGGNRTFEANGTESTTGALLDASSLTSLTGATINNQEMRVNAVGGGLVDLGGVTTLGDSSFLFKASGAGSVIDLSGVTNFVDTGFSLDISVLEAAADGAVLLGTTQPLTFDGYTIRRSGSTSTLDTSQVTTLQNSSAEAIGLGTTLDLTSVASFDGNSLIAKDGAFLTLHGTSYTAGGNRTFEANGTEAATPALLDASSLTTLTGASANNQEMRVNALGGGLVDLGGVTTLGDSSFLFKAGGAGSAIDLSGVEDFVDTGAGLDVSSLEATDGAAILLGTTQPLSIDGYRLLRRGAASTLDTSQLTNLADSTLEASGLGTTFDLTSVTSFDTNSFIASDGASLELLGAGYSAGTGSRRLAADGAESGTAAVLDASSFTSLAGATASNAELAVDAAGGGLVDLSNVASLADGSVEFVATGAGSVIDLSSLETYVDTGSTLDVSSLEVADGATIQLSSEPLSIDGYRLIVRGASTLDTSGVTSLSNSEAHAVGVDAVLDLSAIASADTNSFWAEDGAQVTVSSTSYAAGPASRKLRAEGTGGSTASLLDGSSLLTIVGTTAGGSARLDVDAAAGGLVDLSALTGITGGRVQVSAVGAGSVVDLSAMSSFVGTVGTSRIEASDGGAVLLEPVSTTSLTGVDVVSSSTGTITGAEVVALAGSRVLGNGRLDFFALTVDGGTLSPGSPAVVADDLTLAGDYEQTADGTFDVDIGSLLAIDVDHVDVLGTATLGGQIAVRLIRPTGGDTIFDPQIGDSFDVLTATNIVDAGFFVSTGLSGGRFWQAGIVNGLGAGQTLRLTVALPEPSTLLLVVGGLVLAAAAGGRRPQET